MGLSDGKQSNGKLRWRWVGNVKMDLHDRLCVCVLVWGDWHRLMPTVDFDTDRARLSGSTTRGLAVLFWM
jgi:hypothetical protein